MRMKKFLSIFMSLVMLVSITAGLDMSVYASTYSGNCGNYSDNVTWFLNTETGTLTISGTGGMEYYNSSSHAPWYSYRDSVKKAVISSGVTSIGKYAFYDCTNLESVTIGNSVTSIGSYAFAWCESLKNLTIPDSVTSIGERAFSGCTSLTSVTIPDSVTSIGDGAFYDCISLKSVTIPDSVTSIGERAFSGCTSLTSVTIPDSVTSIGDGAFYNTSYYNNEANWTDDVLYINNALIEAKETISDDYIIKDGTTVIADYGFSSCTSLPSITIPNSVRSIGYYAFNHCTDLDSITIGNGVTSIGNYAFCNCTSLKKVNIYSLETWCKISFNYSYSNPLYYAHNLYLDDELVTDLVIPDSVTSIGYDAFEYCTSLESVTIPNSVTSIDSGAFYNCTSLNKVNIRSIEVWCKISFYYHSNPLYYAHNLYLNDELVTDLVIPDSIDKINDYAFYNCTSLESVTIPDSVTSIGYDAFCECTSLKSVTIPDSVTSIGYDAFCECTSLKSVTIPDSVTNINGGAFEGCISLESVTIGNGVTSIGDGAFEGCTSLESVTIGNSVTRIGGHAFGNCTKLNKVNIHSIEAWCNINFTVYAEDETGIIVFSSNPLYYAKNLYLNDNLITDLIIPDGVEKINNCAFYNCTSLISVTIPDSVTSIVGFAFNGCRSLNKVIIENIETWCKIDFLFDYEYDYTVKTFDGNGQIFYIDQYSKTGTENANPLKYAHNLYVNDELVTDLVIPDSMTSIGNYAFRGCTSISSVTLKNPNCTLGTDSIPSNATIYAHSDSKAQTYANSNNINFVPIHIWDNGTETAATCASSGMKIYTCTVCGVTKSEITPATGHTVVSDAAVPATCSQSGLTAGSHCSKCGAVIKAQEIIPTTSHTYAEKIEKDPNCCWEGTMRYTCVSCGNSYTTVIPATGQHTFSEHVRVAATCTSDGVMDHICEFCQYAYSTVIPATGKHEYGSDGKCIYCNAYNTVAVVSVGGETYTLDSNNEYVSSTVKKPGISKLTKGKKQFKVTWKKVSGVTGYQVQYATDKKFKKNKKTVTVKGAKTTSKTVKSLKSKKTYYVRVRTYKTVKVNGKSTKVYSGWSKAKSVKTK